MNFHNKIKESSTRVLFSAIFFFFLLFLVCVAACHARHLAGKLRAQLQSVCHFPPKLR